MDTKTFVQASVDKTLDITPSVITLARISKVEPSVFAKALADRDGDADYIIALAGELMKAQRAVELKKKDTK